MEETSEVEKEQVTWPGPRSPAAHLVVPTQLSFSTSFHPSFPPPEELVGPLLSCGESYNGGLESIVHNTGSPKTQ